MKNLILIGMPGAGKSTVGVVLAKRLGMRFVDSDLVIQEHYGKLLHELIHEHGVEGFWKLEEEINASMKFTSAVISTGGSAVYGEKAMKRFRRSGKVIYLKLPCQEIAERLGDLNERGVTMQPGQSLEDLFEERRPLYEKYAHLTVDCSGKSLREIVEEIAKAATQEPSKSAKREPSKSATQEPSRSAKREPSRSAKREPSKSATQEPSKSATQEPSKSAGKRGRASLPKKDPLKDKDIREPLFAFLEETYGKIRILEEKTMGRSRADVVMVTPDALYGIEIKSDADTYVRLADQVKDYDQYFDYNIVVVGTSHGEHVPEHVPEHWGIITVEIVDGAFDFYVLRKAERNAKRKWKKKLELLWRPELAQIQEWNEMPKYKNLSKAKVSEKILERVPEHVSDELLAAQVSEILFERDYSKVRETLAEYRKGEIEKKLEMETDPEKRLELILRREASAKNLPVRQKRRYRRRRR